MGARPQLARGMDSAQSLGRRRRVEAASEAAFWFPYAPARGLIAGRSPGRCLDHTAVPCITRSTMEVRTCLICKGAMVQVALFHPDFPHITLPAASCLDCARGVVTGPAFRAFTHRIQRARERSR